MNFKQALKIAFALFLLFLLSLNFDWGKAFLDFQSLSFFDFGISFLLSLFCFWVGTYKWHLLIPEHSLSSLSKFNFISQYYSLLLSGQLGGETVKTYWLGKSKKNVVRAAGSVFIDKVTGFLALMALAILGACFSEHLAIHGRPIFYLICLMGVSFLCLFLVCHNAIYGWVLGISEALSKKWKLFNRFPEAVKRFLDYWKDFSQDQPLLWRVCGLGIVHQGLSIAMVYWLSYGLGIDVSYGDWCWIIAILACALLVPITIGGIGVREVTLISTLKILGVAPEKALALSMAIFLLQILLAFVGALFHMEWPKPLKRE